jgi:hypothetical protein
MSRPDEYFLVFANSDYTLDLARFLRTESTDGWHFFQGRANIGTMLIVKSGDLHYVHVCSIAQCSLLVTPNDSGAQPRAAQKPTPDKRNHCAPLVGLQRLVMPFSGLGSPSHDKSS